MKSGGKVVIEFKASLIAASNEIQDQVFDFALGSLKKYSR